MSFTIQWVILIVLGGFGLLFHFRKTQRLRLPPGPQPLPIVGNIRDLPSGKIPEYQHWLTLKNAYGPISCISIFGQLLILLHDRHATHEILEKTSIKTSGRPYMHFAAKLCGYGDLLSFQQYDSKFRQHRKLVHQQLGTRALAAKFRDTQDVESLRLLFRILEAPRDLLEHVKVEASAIILRMTYGYSVEPRLADPLTTLIQRMMHAASIAAVPLKWPVDSITSLEYLPERLPGMSFKKVARGWKALTDSVCGVPYLFVRQQMETGVYRSSYVSRLVEQTEKSGELNEGMENAIKGTAAVMFAGGADTTVSSISSMILAMTLFPAVQKRAQCEIDAVIGADRFPQLEDRDNLPYINALVKETLRWLPVAPMGLAHKTDEDISYGGFEIPKGSLLLPAIWWFLHDPKTYSDPLAFDPDRYLEPRNEPDPATQAFGYGRRVCPGRFVAEDSLFFTISRLLTAFNITKAIDEEGNEIEPKIDTTTGLICRPLDFPFAIKPRSAHHVSLIKAAEAEHPWEKGDASLLPQGFSNCEINIA